MIKVNSSNIEAVGYCEDDKVLTVQFKGGSIYEYLDIPQSIYADLINESISEGGSVGKCLNQYVKPNAKFRRKLTRTSLGDLLVKINKSPVGSKTYAISQLVETFGLKL